MRTKNMVSSSVRNTDPRGVLLLMVPAAIMLLFAGCANERWNCFSQAIDVVLVAGQSNAVGFDALPSDLPPDPVDQQVLFWWRCGDPSPDEHDSTSLGRWTHLQPQPRGNPISTNKPYINRQYGNFAQPEGGFGPEMGLARTLVHTERRRLAIIKVAFSGTGMRTDWNPSDPGEGGACYRALVSETREALRLLRDQGHSPRLRALVWIQGESDANKQDAPNYTSALGTMIASLREDLATPELPALIGINTRNSLGRNPFIPMVIEAQKALAIQDPRIAFVDTSAASVANEAHWDSAGTLDVGRWFAEALPSLERTSGTATNRRIQF